MRRNRKTKIITVLSIILTLSATIIMTSFRKAETVHADDPTELSGDDYGIHWHYDFGTHTFTVSPYGSYSYTGWMDDYSRYGATPWEDAGVPEQHIQKVVVEEGVYKIGNHAFDDCGYIDEITLPYSLHTVGNYAFRCAGEDIDYDVALHGQREFFVIGTKAFAECKINGHITMAEGWRRLNENAFTGTHIESLRICNPDPNECVWQEAAFEEALCLFDVTLCEGLTYLPEDTFNGCTSLRCVEFPEHMYVDEGAFDGCEGIQHVYFNGLVQDIHFESDNAFIANRTNYFYRENWEIKYQYRSGYELYCYDYNLIMPGCELNGGYWLVRTNIYVYNKINVTEDSTIILLDNCGLTVNDSICIFEGKTLNIVSESLNVNTMGYLKAFSRTCCAGIGTVYDKPPSLININIYGGNIEAHGANCGPGIGSILNSNITIYGGKIKAYGALSGAGIGSGATGLAHVIINDGDIEAYGGQGAAGIGNGYFNCEGNFAQKDTTFVKILGGNIKAVGGYKGAGIGCGESSGNLKVEIRGGNINATGGYGAAGIGSGTNGISSVEIRGGNINATGGYGAAGIGSGLTDDRITSDCEIKIYSSKINAIAGDGAEKIGKGKGSKVTIENHTTLVTGTILSGGSIAIISIVCGLAVIAIFVIVFLSFKKRRK